MDAFMLSRIQFALNISFHILFPALTIAMCWFLLFFKMRYDYTGDEKWLRAYRFWVKLFALTFAIGVVSGITMSFQFGTNWPGYMEKVGNIAGPLLGYEVLTAFFLEATFLGVMLFGQGRVPNWLHTVAAALVAVGTTTSAFWILALNSWMQTPQGHEVIDGVVHAKDWWAVIFNPSFPYRLTHMLLASGLTAAFFIAGISAYRILFGDKKEDPRLTLKVALGFAALLIPIQIFVGDLHGLNTLKHQPAKVAAMEAVWDSGEGIPLLLFAVPDESAQKNYLEIPIPHGASLILTHSTDGYIKGLKDFEGDHPPVAPVFYGFRIMVGMGMLMLAVSWFGVYRYIRRKEMPVWFLKTCVGMTFAGWIATLAGWYVTEIGRQPWLVHGFLRTKDAVTTVPPANIGLSLTLYVIVYAVLFGAYISTIFLMARRASREEAIDTSKPTDEHPLQGFSS
ncbi:Cytochrome bd-II ubiquinol oxidase subunit 1 [BD1-7 clade bacterium]|uniref:Cytochrome bd-II ubiquinol oxidase subunit 1 n=1 Tax=BD1-7 clade bacterium TaxID=2029982 RepID=A0A5S9QWH2_9GAMM|nr:Cytochrome bd-II ubiquinol oxidase subunit 1 [BD1-7 clade bacterium]